jgi:hypothetical protein
METIPNGAAGTQAIGSQDSQKDTQTPPEGTGINQSKTGDSANADTKGADDDKTIVSTVQELAKQVTEMNRKFSDTERRAFERNRAKVETDVAELVNVYKDNPEHADRIVKDIFGQTYGLTTFKEFAEFAQQNEKIKQEHPESVELYNEMGMLKRQNQELKANLESVSNQVQGKELEATLYAKYPDLSKQNDPNDERYVKWKTEFDSLSPNLEFTNRMQKAYLMAFGTNESQSQDREIDKSFGNLPSTGYSMSGSSQKDAPTQRELYFGKLMGLKAEDFQKHFKRPN